jgi:hypothetical protein
VICSVIRVIAASGVAHAVEELAGALGALSRSGDCRRPVVGVIPTSQCPGSPCHTPLLAAVIEEKDQVE